MQLERFAPTLLSRDVAATRDFYVTRFGFRAEVDIGWFVSLRHDAEAYELCLVAADHPSTPERFRRPSEGVIIGFLVADASAEEARLRAAGTEIVEPLRDEPWGQRHFYVADPDGVLIDVVQQTTPSAAWLAEHAGMAGIAAADAR
ncbi:Glyoxalase family protein [Patulibacter medicamentivorans]|uniref:Glyoxalase family protein n=2 Tax=Patulibacter medicamentivorans TaxID=1097667 RepID=H0E0S5_9ACTN|nr:Glyoxalase family protein [Patulibacter medicamentivorans]